MRSTIFEKLNFSYLHLRLESIFFRSLFEVHPPVVELAAVGVGGPLALAPGPVLELAGVCPHPHLEVVQLPLLLLAQHAVRLVHLTHVLILLLAALELRLPSHTARVSAPGQTCQHGGFYQDATPKKYR